MRDDFKADSVEIAKIDGLDDAEVPITLEFDAKWDNYAEVTNGRVIFRPSVFHGQSKSPFSSDTRYSQISFPYKWSDHDDVKIRLPKGYVVESPSMPPSLPGKELDYEITIGLLRKTNQLALKRTFTNSVESVAAANYGPIKEG